MPDAALNPELPAKPRLLLENALLALAYALAAWVGLRLDAVSGFASLVWPASGIALGAIVLRGPKLLPGVFIGAFAANYINGAHFLPAMGIAIGNSLEPLAGTYALRSLGFNPSLKRLRDAIILVIVAAASTLIAATIGVTSLVLSGIAAASAFGETFRAWWIGDLIGDLTVAPMIFVWSRTLAHRPYTPRVLESAGLAVIAAVTVLLVFALPATADTPATGAVYLVFPVLIWAAVRFGPRGAISTGFVVTAVAIIATVGGTGPFANQELHRGLLELQMFVGVEAATFLILGASIGERRESERAASDARAVAEDANRAKSDFLAVMSHELRTPLNAISGYVQLMEMEMHGPLTSAQRDSLDRIQRNQRHLLTLINDVLGFARIETGNLTLKLEAIPLCEAMDEIEALISPDVMRKKISYSAASEAKGLTVFADRERLRQILLNLAGNAVKFTPEGGSVRITASRDESGCIVIRVRDTGIGIAPEHIVQVFEPFVQADKGATRNYPGVGLGLSIVKDLAMAMKGQVWLESTVGQGTCVNVRLPEGPPVEST